MSTSPSLLPQTELEPPAPKVSSYADNASDEEIAECPQLIMLGDSITQFSTLTLQAYLQTQYIRRLDVVNRGLSGFTAPMGFRALQKFLPSTGPGTSWPRVKLTTVFFGANDACIPGEHQHVELEKYVDAVKKTIDYPVFNQDGDRKTQLIIITPPPINEHQLVRTPSGHFQRRAGITSQYARAARRLGVTHGVRVLDFWSISMHKVGWRTAMGVECCSQHIPYQELPVANRNPNIQHIPGCFHAPPRTPNAEYQLSDFLTDGLHLTKLGYDVLFWELLKLIKLELPQCAPENLPFVLPEWRHALQLPGFKS